MPEIKLKHVVSCSTEDTVSQYETYNRPFVISFAHWVEWEPCVLSRFVMMSYRLTRRTTCWALTPTESGKQRDPVRSKHRWFCRYVSALLLPQKSACSAYVMRCFVVIDVIRIWLSDQLSPSIHEARLKKQNRISHDLPGLGEFNSETILSQQIWTRRPKTKLSPQCSAALL